jgi:hypothetical protein
MMYVGLDLIYPPSQTGSYYTQQEPSKTYKTENFKVIARFVSVEW